MTRRVRFSGHSTLNNNLRADWMKAIELSPDAFDALLYLPDDSPAPDAGGQHYEQSIFDDLDANQDTLSYKLPEPVVVLDCPDENEQFLMMADGDGQLGEGLLPLTLRIAREHVPEGAYLEWDEEISEGKVRRVWWYVHRAIGFGTANVGALYICIPARNVEEINLPTQEAI